MIGLHNCLITGVQLQPTVHLHCLITTLQRINFVQIISPCSYSSLKYLFPALFKFSSVLLSVDHPKLLVTA